MKNHLFHAVKKGKNIEIFSKCGLGEFTDPCLLCMEKSTLNVSKWSDKYTLAFLKTKFSHKLNDNEKLVDDIISFKVSKELEIEKLKKEIKELTHQPKTLWDFIAKA